MVYAGVIGLEGARPAYPLCSRSSVVGVQGSRSTVDPTGIRHRRRNRIAIGHGIAVREIQLAAADSIEEAEAHGEFHFLSFHELRTENEVTGGKVGFDGVRHFVLGSGIQQHCRIVLYVFGIMDMRTAETQCHTQVPVLLDAVFGADGEYRVLREGIELFLDSHTAGYSTVDRRTGFRLNGQSRSEADGVESDTYCPGAYARLIPLLRLRFLVLGIEHRKSYERCKKG